MPLSFRASSLWAHRDFLRLWIGQSASQLGVLRAVQQLPILVCSLFVGVLVDRWRSRNVMVTADVGRALALAAVPLGWALGMPFLYVVAFVVGVFTVCFDVAYLAALPRLVRRDQLAQGNSMLESTASAAQICGPALGGGLVSLLTAPIAVLASAALFAFSSLSIGRVRGLSGPRAGTSPGGVIRQIGAGLRIVVRDESLRAIATATCIYEFSFTALSTAYLLFLTRALELPGAVVGLVLAAFGPGVLIGSLLSAWMPRRFGYGRVVVFAALISDLIMLATSSVHGSGLWTIAVLVAINVGYGAFAQSVNVAMMAIRQAVTPLPVQGRVVATINFLGEGLTPLGALLGGAAAGALGIRSALLLATAGLFLSPLFLSVSALARLGHNLTQRPG